MSTAGVQMSLFDDVMAAHGAGGECSYRPWTPAEDAFLRAHYETMSRDEIGARLGVSGKRVNSRCCALGLNSKIRKWTAEEESRVRALYDVPPGGVLAGSLLALARSLGRHPANVVRKARTLGINPDQRRRRVEQRKPPRPRVTANDDELRALVSARMRKLFAERGHPRGALGMRHSEENKRRQSERSRAAWANMTEDQKQERAMKIAQTRAKNGKLNERKGVTWKGGWREIGGIRKYYRSRWEANYARYLEWLKSLGKVAAWAHEPETFWFKGVKRGCVSYLPDFRVERADGRVEYHEVKGWMDPKSMTKIKRMAKYHPSVTLVVIDGKAYGQLAKAVGALIGGWE